MLAFACALRNWTRRQIKFGELSRVKMKNVILKNFQIFLPNLNYFISTFRYGFFGMLYNHVCPFVSEKVITFFFSKDETIGFR